MERDEILTKIHELYTHLREEKSQQWQRDLPFGELLFDRWERANHLNFGKNTSIYHNSYVYGEVKVGQNTWIGPFTILDGTGGLEIGDWCCISANVQIYTHDTVRRFVSSGQETTDYSSVKIENNCYVGPNTIISRGTKIGHHSIIGAASFVNKDIPPFSIVYGTPAKIVGHIEYDVDGKLIFIDD